MVLEWVKGWPWLDQEAHACLAGNFSQDPSGDPGAQERRCLPCHRSKNVDLLVWLPCSHPVNIAKSIIELLKPADIAQ